MSTDLHNTFVKYNTSIVETKELEKLFENAKKERDNLNDKINELEAKQKLTSDEKMQLQLANIDIKLKIVTATEVEEKYLAKDYEKVKLSKELKAKFDSVKNYLENKLVDFGISGVLITDYIQDIIKYKESEHGADKVKALQKNILKMILFEKYLAFVQYHFEGDPDFITYVQDNVNQHVGIIMRAIQKTYGINIKDYSIAEKFKDVKLDN